LPLIEGAAEEDLITSIFPLRRAKFQKKKRCLPSESDGESGAGFVFVAITTTDLAKLFGVCFNKELSHFLLC